MEAIRYVRVDVEEDCHLTLVSKRNFVLDGIINLTTCQLVRIRRLCVINIQASASITSLPDFVGFVASKNMASKDTVHNFFNQSV